MSILFLLEGGQLPGRPGKEGWSGINRYWLEAISLIRGAGHDVTLGTLRERSPLHEPVEAIGCRTFELHARSSLGYPRAISGLISLLRTEEFDVLHLNESIQAAIGGAARTLARRPATVFHRHHTQLPGPSRYLSRFGAKVADLTMCVSQSVANHALALDRIDKSRVRVAYNGISDVRTVTAEEIEALRRRWAIPPGEPVVVVVGHLRPEKGHETLFEAMDGVAQRVQGRIHLAVVGTGPAEAEVIGAAAAYDGYSIHLTGHIEDVIPWYRMADVVVVPSLKEPFGLVAVEGMACSRPVIASDVDGLAEVIGSAGILVAPGDAEALSDSLVKCLSDRSLAERLATSGRDRFLTLFTVEAMVQRWLECYADALRLRSQLPTAPS